MNNIPKKLRAELAVDPEYKLCMVTGEPARRGDPIQWHHAMIFAGRQVQKRFAIVAIKKSIHEEVHNPVIKEFIDWIVLNRMTESELDYYSKAVDLRYRKEQLNIAYGVYTPRVAATGINYPSNM